MYENLEFPLIKKAVSENCSFSLGQKIILEESVHFDYLWCERELNRGKEALKLYVAYRSPSFAGVRDLSKVFMDIDKGRVASEIDLFQIMEFSRAGIAMKKYMQESTLDTPYIKDLTDSLSVQRKIIDEIERSISSSYEVKSSASSELKSIRRSLSQCESDILKATAEVMNRYSDSLMDRITVTRSGRTCLLVKISDKNKIRGFIHGESASGQAVYIEPEILLQLNNKLQSLKAKESEEIYRILKELTNLVKKEVHTYTSDLHTFSLLDALFAKARWAYEREGMYATLTKDEKTLYFKNARHPLIDPKKVVSNTYKIALPYRHMLITGSNTGGKTVTLKTIGLFTILTLSGFPLLCDEAIVPCFEGVYVDIGDSQSIVESLSTFSAHISKLAAITNNANDHSLVLLDELGSGTDPKEGSSLAISMINYMKSRGATIIVTTHYSDLKTYAYNTNNVLNASVEFNSNTLMPTYRLLVGVPGKSNAIEIAKRLGIPEEIINNSKSYMDDINSGENSELMNNLEEEITKLREQEEELTHKIEMYDELNRNLSIEKVNLTKQTNKIITDAKNEAKNIIKDAKDEAAKLISEIKDLANVEYKEHELADLKYKVKNLDVDANDLNLFDEELVVGDYVYIKPYEKNGTITKIKKDKYTVQMGQFSMDFAKTDLTKAAKPKEKVVKQTRMSGYNPASHASLSLDLRGKRYEEVKDLMDQYLDQAILGNLETVTIIHGFGTGVIRNAVQDYLKKCPYVKSYRYGGEGEGLNGATVVKLK